MSAASRTRFCAAIAFGFGVASSVVAEGRTTKEIRRCLKRYLARQLYRTLEALHAVPDIDPQTT